MLVHRILSVAAAICFLVTTMLSTSSAQVATTPINSKSHVTLSLEEFQELFSSARLEDAERRLLDKKKIQDAEYQKKLKDLQAESRKVPNNEEIHRQLRTMFPTNYQVLRHTAQGIYNRTSPLAGVEGDVVSFDLELTIRVMETSGEWTTIPLVNTSSTVASNWQVSLREKQPPPETTQQEGGDDSFDFGVIDTVTDPSALLVVRNDQHVLATNRSGLFRVSFTAYTRVGKNRNTHSVGLSSLLYPFTDFSLRIVKRHPRNVIKDLSVQPTASILQVHPSNNYTDIAATLPLQAENIQIRWTDTILALQQEEGETEEVDYDSDEAATTPSSGSQQAQSTTTSSSPSSPTAPTQRQKRQQQQEQQQVTATHEALHTIDEGSIIRSVHNLEFKTSNQDSPLNNVEFEVHGGYRLRINSVVGHALESWTSSLVADQQQHTTRDSNTTTTIEGDDDDGDDSKKPSFYHLVKVYFKTSQIDTTAASSSSVMLQVHTEQDNQGDGDMKDGDNDDNDSKTIVAALPSIICRNVLRQTGQAAIMKDANVEVHEMASNNRGIARCDPADLSSRLRLNVDRPIVYSYKYMNPTKDSTLVKLGIQQHVAMDDDTLEATIDRVHYKAVVTPTHIIHSTILHLQSTKLQYLELTGLDSTASRFTTLVNSVPVKPVKGRTRQQQTEQSQQRPANQTTVLIPLLVGLNSDSTNNVGYGSALRTSVEISYFTSHKAISESSSTSSSLGRNGTLPIQFPKFEPETVCRCRTFSLLHSLSDRWIFGTTWSLLNLQGNSSAAIMVWQVATFA